jgi:hypothetical protein
MGMALLVSFAMGSWAYGQCSNDAGAGDKPEGETCLVDLDDDTVNGGCNGTPAVFTTLDTADFTTGFVDLCGIGSNYNVNTSCTTDADCDPGETCVDGGCTGGDEPAANRRDTDWYLVTQAAMTAHDADSNGVVQVNSTYVNSELDLVTFLIGITDPSGGTCDSTVLSSVGCNALGGEACDVNADCPSGDCVGDPVPGDGNADGICAADNVTATETLIIADYPNGVVVFASPGQCSGGGIFDGFECSTGNNDYILRVWFTEAPTGCQPGPPQGPCNEPALPPSPGCEDPSCCALVCGTPGLAFCCSSGWFQSCANAAIDLGCAPEPGGPVLIATGDDPAVDGYLQVGPDPYGAYADADFAGIPEFINSYNPPGPLGVTDPGPIFSIGYFYFLADANQRELAANVPFWKFDYGVDDDSLDSEILALSTETDTNSDGVSDQLNSQYRVFGTGFDVTCDLQQNVESHAGGISTWTQSLSLTNNLASPVSFDLLRVYDGDHLWVGDATDDSAGTGTNGNPGADRYVFMQETGDPATAMTMSCSIANFYSGSKLTVNPDPNDPDCPDYDYGTDVQHWEDYGMPACWQNNIANVGYNLDGVSGGAPGTDAKTLLNLPIELPAGPGPAVVVEFMHTYGQQTPHGQEGVPCPWDCQPVPNGDVDVPDFLAILAQWGMSGTSCDFGTGDPGVGINEFLDFLANFGPCP